MMFFTQIDKGSSSSVRQDRPLGGQSAGSRSDYQKEHGTDAKPSWGVGEQTSISCCRGQARARAEREATIQMLWPARRATADDLQTMHKMVQTFAAAFPRVQSRNRFPQAWVRPVTEAPVRWPGRKEKKRKEKKVDLDGNGLTLMKRVKRQRPTHMGVS